MSELFFLTREDDIKKIVNDIINELKKSEQPPVEADEKPEKLYTTAEACEILRCSKPTPTPLEKGGDYPVCPSWRQYPL